MISLPFDRTEALRYMGISSPDKISESIHVYEEYFIRAENALRCLDRGNGKYGRTVYRIFPSPTPENWGTDIAEHIRGYSEFALFCVTLGEDADRKIREASEISTLDGMITDALAAALTDKSADSCQEFIKSLYNKNNFGNRKAEFTERFSCGYGDFPLYAQQDIIRLLDTVRKIGVTSSRDFILSPRKSVTAVMGIRII